jgi:hypothetical protein
LRRLQGDRIRANPVDAIDAPRFTMIALVEQALDARRQLDASIPAFQPTVSKYAVPASPYRGTCLGCCGRPSRPALSIEGRKTAGRSGEP